MNSVAPSSSSSDADEVLLVAFGNPLLDMTAVVSDTRIHTTYDLPTDGQLEVTEEQKALYSLIAKQYPVQYTAGGCSLNSSRVFAWMLGQRGRVLFVGGIGQDTQADQLTAIIHSSGVSSRLLAVPDVATGRCVALVLGTERCLCADIGAANYCPPQHVFPETPLPELLTASLLYVEGYFITHSFDTAMKIAKFSRENKKTLIFNLCGSYVCQNHPEELAQLLPYVDILFGFVEEYKTLNKYVDLRLLASEHDPKTGPSIVTSLPRILEAVHSSLEPSSAPSSSGGSSSGNGLRPTPAADVTSHGSSCNGSPDTDDNSNSHYFDNRGVVLDDGCLSPTVSGVSQFSMPAGSSSSSAVGMRRSGDTVARDGAVDVDNRSEEKLHSDSDKHIDIRCRKDTHECKYSRSNVVGSKIEECDIIISKKGEDDRGDDEVHEGKRNVKQSSRRSDVGEGTVGVPSGESECHQRNGTAGDDDKGSNEVEDHGRGSNSTEGSDKSKHTRDIDRGKSKPGNISGLIRVQPSHCNGSKDDRTACSDDGDRGEPCNVDSAPSFAAATPCSFSKVVIMTQGPHPLLYVSDGGPVLEKVIAPLSPDAIVDTTGAGDSFVGGFLAALSQGRGLEQCVDGGVWAARQILQQKGCTVPSTAATFL